MILQILVFYLTGWLDLGTVYLYICSWLFGEIWIYLMKVSVLFFVELSILDNWYSKCDMYVSKASFCIFNWRSTVQIANCYFTIQYGRRHLIYLKIFLFVFCIVELLSVIEISINLISFEGSRTTERAKKNFNKNICILKSWCKVSEHFCILQNI